MFIDTLERLHYNAADYKNIIRLTSQGPMLNDNRKAQVVKRKLDVSSQHMGKLLPQRCPEEVAECDGQDGARLCISIGIDVYNITGAYIPSSYLPIDSPRDRTVQGADQNYRFPLFFP